MLTDILLYGRKVNPARKIFTPVPTAKQDRTNDTVGDKKALDVDHTRNYY
jgi:hypothetical protein